MDAIVRLLDDALAAGLGSAAAVSVGDGGREVFSACRGTTRRVPDGGLPIDASTLFDVASLTKPMVTASLAMQLTRTSAFSPRHSISSYLRGVPSGITSEHLLGHAAGCLPHVELFRALPGPPADGEFHWDRYRQLVALAAAQPWSAPGVAAVYSDLGYILLGAVLESAANQSLPQLWRDLVALPLGLTAHFIPSDRPLATIVATELDERGDATTTSLPPVSASGAPVVLHAQPPRGLIQGRVHDENAFYAGGVCGHAGLFASLADVATFARAMVDDSKFFDPTIRLYFTHLAAAPNASWRLGWDTPSATPGVSHAGDRWPRVETIGHLGFTGTSVWLDQARGRWVVLLTNRVHPTRFGGSAEAIKALRRAVNDAALDALDGPLAPA